MCLVVGLQTVVHRVDRMVHLLNDMRCHSCSKLIWTLSLVRDHASPLVYPMILTVTRPIQSQHVASRLLS